jgi:PTH1 family peptidyl-tRNA hydrolase
MTCEKLLLVGLGNPGRLRNRHNAGHRVIDCINHYLTANSIVDGIEVIARNTDVFMNVSGAFVKKLRRKHPSAQLWVLHDDLEVACASVKWKYGGSAGGHNGLRDITQVCGAEYGRVRIGVGRPDDRAEVRDFVLQDHTPAEREKLDAKEDALAQFMAANLRALVDCDLDALRLFK